LTHACIGAKFEHPREESMALKHPSHKEEKHREHHKGLPHHEERALHASYEVPAGKHVAGHKFGGSAHGEHEGKKNHEHGYPNTRHERMQYPDESGKPEKVM